MNFPKFFWLSGLAAAAVSSSSAPALAQSQASPAKVDHGRTVFQQNCAICHATTSATNGAAGQGPSLAGIIGRPAASLTNFGYSKALRASTLAWDPATLDRYLANPTALVPGTNMVVSLANTGERHDVISFLATLTKPAGSEPVADSVSSTAGDWREDFPGAKHRIDLARLPPPYATRSAGNGPRIIDRPTDAHLSVPAGFKIELFASNLDGPRLLRVAPNGDIFIAETGSGRIRILRGRDGASTATQDEIFAAGLRGPFGIAFYPAGADPQWVYVANVNSVVRFPYHNGDLTARGPAQTVVARLSDSTGGHTTRDIAFSLDGKRLFISVGSGSNVAEGMDRKSAEQIRAWESVHGFGATWGSETNRADILHTDPEGKEPLRMFATGIRNAVGLAVHPATGDLWCSTNERDGLGDDLVPDYVSRVREGGYYGWPWYFMGNHEDPRHAGARPDLAGKAIVPDVPLQAHSAALEMTFYNATSGGGVFPAEFRGDAFVSLHGSWNRATRTANKVIRVRLKNGIPTGEYEDFVTGFVVDNETVWGRPVGVAVAHDGALLITDDANNTLWRISPK